MLGRSAFINLIASYVALPAVPMVFDGLERSYSPQVIRGDLDAIWSTLIEVGVEPFRTSDRSTVEAIYRQVRAAIASPMSLREAWLAISPVLGALNDGHVGLGFPSGFREALYQFPLGFALSADGMLIVASDHTGTVPIGSRIVSIQGVSAADYREATLRDFGGQTPTLHRERVAMAGAWTAVALFGARSAYDVRWVTPQGAEAEGEIPAALPRGGVSAAPYAFNMLSSGTVGYIDYRSCEDLPQFNAFLETTFAQMRAASTRALIIDIRRNGGGDSKLNDLLWTYAQSKPFKQFGGIISKSCARLKGEYGEEKYVRIYGEEAWNAPDGTILTSGTDPAADLVVPGPLDIRFSGPVYLLISADTFSSAMSCALAAKDYGLATIVGEETGEPVNTTGELYTEITPGLGLRAYLTTKVFLAPRPHPNNQGVVPDVPVPTTYADQSAHRDPVLEKTLAMISASH